MGLLFFKLNKNSSKKPKTKVKKTKTKHHAYDFKQFLEESKVQKFS